MSTTRFPSPGWTITDWQAAYRSGRLQARDVLTALVAAHAKGAADTAWISRLDAARSDALLTDLDARLAAVDGDLSRLPLYGIPFAAKDNIDVAGWPTTAACPEFAYQPATDATVVARLRAAGALVVGKTNLDQFATGLVGTRSPHGAVPCAFDSRYVSGGSSSGSASVVARGLVPFALGTDTAGSGRVPASFNNIVGLKPTRGWLSSHGVVPACRTVDCVSVFALTVEDALLVADIAGGYDAADAYSRPAPAAAAAAAAPIRLAVPDTLEFFGDARAEAAFRAAMARWQELGAEIVPIDFAPFSELAALLYQGPWVAERFAAAEILLASRPEAVHPVVRGILEGAVRYSAADAFKAEYRRAELARTIQDALAGFDALLVPTAPTHYTIAAVEADPVALNSRLGIYTNFTNLADLAALALPAALRDDGLPAGISLIGLAWCDHALARLGARWQAGLALPLGATGRPLPAERLPLPPAAPATIRLAVVGAHLSGMPLNPQLTSRGATLAERCRTAPDYRLYALADTVPAKPGLARTEAGGGAAIEVELWDVPIAGFATFVAEVPPPLGIGTLTLEDGRQVKGFICEPWALAGARDITAYGGWRAFLAGTATAAPAASLAA